MVKNSDVAESWKHDKSANGSTTTTDGQNIYSYNLRIGYTDENNQKVAIDYTTTGGSFYSMTTSKHVSYAKRYADIVILPKDTETKNRY